MQFSFLFGNLNGCLTNLFAYCKINDLESFLWFYHFMLQGFLIFTLHCMRNTQVRKINKLIVNSISSSFSVSIDIRVLVLRTVFRFARLSADQRAIQKKDEHRFSVFYKGQIHEEEFTGQSKWGWGYMDSLIAVLC